uniref:Uncharacterized protein n=1 Tax=Fusarium oxysporum (strain Fo5176) TaxID=660025 RepID=A0A0D2XF91_FUSOF
MAAAAGQVAGTVVKIAISSIEKEQADQAAEERQNQIMSALNNIQDTLQSIQVQQEQLTDIGMLFSSLTIIETWQNDYPIAVQNNDTNGIKSYLHAFNSKGAEGAAYNVQNIFNVLTGQDASLIHIRPRIHNRSTLCTSPIALGWAFGMAGFALACQIIALQDKTTTHEEIQREVEQLTSQFTANVNEVFKTAYKQFPAFVKKFKLSYQDEGSNLTNWFRMWRNNSHVKNYTPIAGGPHVINPFDEFPNSGYPAQAFEVYPAPCDDAEGIYPEVEFRFDETNHPLKGLATIYSRDGDLPLLTYLIEGRMGLTTTTDPSYWDPGVDTNGILNIPFNVLPSPWVRTDGGPALPPGQQPTAPGPNPVDDGQQQSQWRPDQFVS